MKHNYAELNEIENTIITLTMKLEDYITTMYPNEIDETDDLVKLYRAIGRAYPIEF